MVEHTMDVSSWLRKQLEEASPDLLRAMVKLVAGSLGRLLFGLLGFMIASSSREVAA